MIFFYFVFFYLLIFFYITHILQKRIWFHSILNQLISFMKIANTVSFSGYLRCFMQKVLKKGTRSLRFNVLYWLENLISIQLTHAEAYSEASRT